MGVIGIDASRAETNQRSGTENYSYQIVKSIASADRQSEICLYTKSSEPLLRGQGEYRNVSQVHISYEFLWTQLGLALKTWTDDLDVLFVPAHVIPFLKSPKTPVVVTVHDLRTEFLPQHSSPIQKLYLNVVTEKVRARLAKHIIAVSESTKNDVMERLGVSAEDVTVIYEGVDHHHFNFKKGEDAHAKKRVMGKYGLSNDYLLFVGTIQPRKNLVRLMDAFAKVASDRPDIDLVIAGGKGWMYDDILATPDRLGLSNRIRFVDYVENDDLPYLYSSARALILPSLYEGFGLPILESYAMGTPVVTSNISSMPEVGGEFAVYVEPKSTESIASGIIQVLDTEFDAQALVKYANGFTWEKAGAKTLEVLKRYGKKHGPKKS